MMLTECIFVAVKIVKCVRDATIRIIEIVNKRFLLILNPKNTVELTFECSFFDFIFQARAELKSNVPTIYKPERLITEMNELSVCKNRFIRPSLNGLCTTQNKTENKIVRNK